MSIYQTLSLVVQAVVVTLALLEYCNNQKNNRYNNFGQLTVIFIFIEN